MSRETGWMVDVDKLVMGESYRIKTLIVNNYDGWVFAEFSKDEFTQSLVFRSPTEMFWMNEILDIDYSSANPMPADEVLTINVVQGDCGAGCKKRWKTIDKYNHSDDAISDALVFNQISNDVCGINYRAAVITTEVRVINGKVK
jgi:hypothetical protein